MQVIFFTAVNFLPLGLMAAVFRISLVTMAAVASRLIEKERLTVFRLIAVTLGIVGIVLMTQPEFIFGEKHPSPRNGTLDCNNNTEGEIFNVTGIPHLENSSGTPNPDNVTGTPNPENSGTTPVVMGTSDPHRPAATVRVVSTTVPLENTTTTGPRSSSTDPLPSTTPASPDVPAPTPAQSIADFTHLPTTTSASKGTDPRTQSRSIIPTEGLSDGVLMAIGICLTAVAAFLVVTQGVCMKRKVLADYCVWKISFWVGVTGLVWTTSLSVALEALVFISTVKDLCLVATYGILASLHLFTFLYAINKASYLIVAVIMVTQIAFNLLAQYTVLSSIFPGKHNTMEILGGVTVLVAAALPTVKEALATFVGSDKLVHLARTTVKLASLPITKHDENNIALHQIWTL